MALPESRNTNYAAGTEIKSADLNDLQDAIIGAKHGSVEVMVHALAAEPTQGCTVQSNRWIHDGAGTDILSAKLPDLPVGTRVDAIKVYIEQSAINEVTAEPFSTDVSAGTTSSSISAQKSNGAGTGTREIDFTSSDSGIPFTIEAGKTYHLQIRMIGGAASTAYKGMKLTVVKP